MYSFTYDKETGGILLNTASFAPTNETRPVYDRELDILGFDRYFSYEKNDNAPYMWAENQNYYYRGKHIAQTKGGSLYTPPELVIFDDSPEPDHAPLQPVDIPAMVEKNRPIIEKIAADTIKKIYNVFTKYHNKIDVSYVAFSGGKDSVVVLDLVQRALPHNQFKVLFGDTNMEFPTTIDLVSDIEKFCKKENIDFYTASAHMPASQSWDIFGPPARRVRWCCTVHKTAPVINKLCELYDLKAIHAMMITGVRGEESPSRGKYEELSKDEKLPGQYSFHPILDWSAAEVYTYIYANNLLMNQAYKYGFNRIGCIMCPNSSEKHEYIKRECFPEKVDFFCNKIISNSKKDLSGANAKHFLEIGGWKTRLSGRELKLAQDELFDFEEKPNHLIFTARNLKPDWITWYKTLGDLQECSKHEYKLEYHGTTRKCILKQQDQDNLTIFEIEKPERTKNSIEFTYYFKSILAKTQYCIQCMSCVAACPSRYIQMANGKLSISDQCVRCHSCLKLLNGCLYYNSIKGSRSMKATGINRYLSVGVDAEWIKKYLKDQSYEPGNRKTDVMYSMLNDAGVTFRKQLTNFGKFIQMQDINSPDTWALLLCNLAYTPAFGWYIHHIPFSERYEESQLQIDLGEDSNKSDGGKKARGEFWNGFKVILDSNTAFKEIGLGIPEIIATTNKNGEIKKRMLSITRHPWENPNPLVILYSLYKFAQACNGYYQFSLTRLLNHDLESDGISPTEIFGIDREKMQRIVTGLSANYSEYVNGSFTLGLDHITLNSEKTSQDILDLF